MKKLLSLLAVAVLLCGWPQHGWALNKKTTVEQVTATVTLSDNTDYIVTSATPFAGNGIVNITNTDHAVLILSEVKPSAAIQLLSAHVQIAGAKAANNTNCQVKLYNRGCIILPYGNSTKPLTVYEEPNFGGKSCNDFGLENDGGYMNTLTDAKLNNKISSFKLKRGYMVTFSNRAGGRGYSRCFIAAYDDLEVAELPAVLDNSISSYRIFKWYDAGKPAVANDTRSEIVKALNVSSCYSFGLGENRLPDAECVPHHIYEDWPSSAACGGVTYSPHLKTNNEPGNSADDRPQTVEEILNNWENLMRTGMRLCSPSSHDGSLQHLRDFLKAIDERGWRCDIIDLHCYWPEGSFGNIKGWVDSYHRPVWISEWVWGASWNNNGIFGEAQGENRDKPTTAQLNRNRDVVKSICNKLNSWDYVERYYYWNSEANCSKLYYDGKLTPAGEMYKELDGGLAYNGKYDYAPKIPKQEDPADLVVVFDKDTKTATLTWYESNGEMNRSATIERRKNATSVWSVIHDIEMKEAPSEYTYVDEEAISGYQYQIHIVDAEGKDRYSKVVMAASNELEVGDAIDVNGTEKYLGGNMIMNGNFEMKGYGWTNGVGEALASPWFQIVPMGGVDNSYYLQCYGDGLEGSESAVMKKIDIEKNTDYYFSGNACNTNSIFSKLVIKPSETDASQTTVHFFSNPTTNWLTQFKVFNSENNALALISLGKLGAKSQFDELMLAKLFDTKEEALADGIAKARLAANTFLAYNNVVSSHVSSYAFINTILMQRMEQLPTEPTEDNLKAWQGALDDAINSYQLFGDILTAADRAKAWATLHLYGYEEVEAVAERVNSISSISEMTDVYLQLLAVMDAYLPYSTISNKITDPKLATASGWTTKCGTYTAGDQRTNSKDGITFWNAWWSGLSATEGTAKTMAIKQEVKDLPHGLYAVSCKAATEHFCLSDQHATITNGSDTQVSPALTANYYDLPSVSADDAWEELTTMPVYVADDGSVTIGFESSKAGAVDNAWHRIGEASNTGDKREGWWCATDFKLLFHPLYKRTVEPNQWGVICLPYAFRAGEGVKLYQIVGINPDYTQLCLEEVSEVEAGMPCIFRSEKAEAVFLEYGKEVTTTLDAPGNIRGFLRTSRAAARDYYFLTNGVWEKVGQDRPTMSDYTGIIRPFNDKDAQPVWIIADWNGATMPINGVTEAEKEANANGISTVTVSDDKQGAVYGIDGRRADNSRRPGIYIINGKKVIR